MFSLSADVRRGSRIDDFPDLGFRHIERLFGDLDLKRFLRLIIGSAQANAVEAGNFDIITFRHDDRFLSQVLAELG